METNSSIIKKFFESVIDVGSQIASKKYTALVLNSLLDQQKEKHLFINYIRIGDNVEVDDKLDEMKKDMLLEPINLIYDYLFLDTTKTMFRETLDKDTLNEFKEFGLHV